ncbi:hypothetical protein PDJAM_G00071180 [Pangasius djambal]|uniref:Uncharacterized protein n=1 Tax=Pangasius djambal TaxID=1691987 RepID=A0ACC5Z0T3_9TELE|nr:hypothetical protein [Pangasius djambal]
MRVRRVKVLVGFVILGLLVAVLFLHRTPSAPTVIHSQKRLNSTIEKLLERNERLKNSDNSIPYHLKEATARRNGCVCEGDAWRLNVPFGNLLFTHVGAEELHSAFRASELEEVKKRRQHEYNNLLAR